jgi:hypothetical protein
MPATYLNSINRFPGDGVTTDWGINFAGGYLRRSHVKSYTLNAAGTIVRLNTLTDASFISEFVVRVTPAASATETVVIYRETPVDLPLVDFVDGSNITEANLDLVTKQAVFIGAETADKFTDLTQPTAVAVASVVAPVIASVTTEQNARIAADNALQTNINAEVSTRAAADTAETAARIAADALKLNLTGGSLTGPVNFKATQDVATAATVDLTNTGNVVRLTGAVTVTALTIPDGGVRFIRFTGGQILQQGTNLRLLGNASVSFISSDVAIFLGRSGGLVEALHIVRSASVLTPYGFLVTDSATIPPGTRTTPIDINLPGGYTAYKLVVRGVKPNANAFVRARLSFDGGSTFVETTSYSSAGAGYDTATDNTTGAPATSLYVSDDATSLNVLSTWQCEFTIYASEVWGLIDSIDRYTAAGNVRSTRLGWAFNNPPSAVSSLRLFFNTASVVPAGDGQATQVTLSTAATYSLYGIK